MLFYLLLSLLFKLSSLLCKYIHSSIISSSVNSSSNLSLPFIAHTEHTIIEPAPNIAPKINGIIILIMLLFLPVLTF